MGKVNRKSLVITVLVGIWLWGVMPVWAEDSSALQGVGFKLTRGMANFGLGWVELPKQIYHVGHEEGWLIGMTRGFIDGVGMFAARTVAGAYELLTFPLPVPPHYQPLLKPDYVWQPEPAETAASTLEPQATGAP
jgi:putative exosortase-associated protein (TIGR04073 family)